MSISRQDLESALDFVGDLHDRAGLADFAERTMNSLLRLAGADRVVYGEYDVERQAARLTMRPSIVGDPFAPVGGALEGLEQAFGTHPLFRHYLQSNDGTAHKLSHVLPRSRCRRYLERDEFSRQLGARHQVALFFPAGPSVVIAILLTRDRLDFTQRDCALLNRLHPHLRLAFRNAASLNRVRQELDDLFEMLEGPTSSVVVLSGDGLVKRWTRQAKNWIAQYCRTPFPASGDRLPECFADWYRRQLQLVAQQTLAPQPRDALVVDKNGRQLTVQLIPDDFRDEHLLLLNEKPGDAPWSALGDCGLTPRESEVLAWVAKGKTNAEIGIILQMSGRTVQKHLEHVYQKLGVAGRTTATVRALKLLDVGTDRP